MNGKWEFYKELDRWEMWSLKWTGWMWNGKFIKNKIDGNWEVYKELDGWEIRSL